MKSIRSALAAAALGLCLLTACGDDDGSKASGSGGDYCSDLKDAKKQVDALKGGDYSGLETTVDRMHDLADEAPDEIKDDWEILVKAAEKVVDALEKAGIDGEDMAALQAGEIPDGVDMAALQGVMADLQGLDTPEFQDAADSINKHAKDECEVDFQA